MFEGAAGDVPAFRLPAGVPVLVGAAPASASGDKAGARIASCASSPADYLNSYYGRLAEKRLGTRLGDGVGGRRSRRSPAPRRPRRTSGGPHGAAPRRTPTVVRLLLSLGLYDAGARRDALRAAQLGRTPGAQRDARLGLQPAAATMRRGIILHEAGVPAVTCRPSGEQLPAEMLRVIFPIDYWPLIRRYAPAQRPRPVSRRGADQPGVVVPGRREVGRERDRADAAAAVHGPPLREGAAHQAVLGGCARRGRR